eukprot:CAMPEP_0119101790 /NCGR_PEP_ID=MMETSP1180-20130426/743_1 /TAXON_ID=3052 ORGANISM="Chlamydomonas cf sp, Strain CCMP681" /NCGR_SAMPLE_ID=MMETSP1180 /ASSEMBLY_ACC=CAM_ASM_000741 /LENGTH=84 /DNA_ID=CAMNT_0007085965 /DNA_START=38 /DNA_END=292 /DNA_ORIENTATION=+
MAAAVDPAARKANLEEDDEFEEFQVEDWQPGRDELKDPQLWDASWDDDSLDDPIGRQLRETLPQVAQQQQQAQQKAASDKVAGK